MRRTPVQIRQDRLHHRLDRRIGWSSGIKLSDSGGQHRHCQVGGAAHAPIFRKVYSTPQDSPHPITCGTESDRENQHPANRVRPDQAVEGSMVRGARAAPATASCRGEPDPGERRDALRPYRAGSGLSGTDSGGTGPSRGSRPREGLTLAEEAAGDEQALDLRRPSQI